MIYIFVVYRFSRDVDSVDKILPMYLKDTLIFLSPLLATLAIVIYGVPLLTVVFLPLILLFLMLQVHVKPLQICGESAQPYLKFAENLSL